ncbi:MAG: serine hydrolase domain-containing protein [Parvularculaceae bacterium]
MPDVKETIGGDASGRFEAVRRAFAEAFGAGEEIGAACAAVLDGKPIVDLWGGRAAPRGDAPWTEETVAPVHSSSKAVAALMLARVVEAGALDYDAPVAEYWPDFAQNGKDDVTVAQTLSHQAGLCGFPTEIDPMEWLDWDALCARLAAMPPLWDPGAQSGYHPRTFGYLAGEIFRRATGGDLADAYAADFPGLAFAFAPGRLAGAPPIAEMRKPSAPPALGPLNPYKEAAFLKPWSGPPMRADLRDHVNPGASGVGSARALAWIMHAFATGSGADGATLLSRRTLDAARKERTAGEDLVLPFRLSYGAGVMRNAGAKLFGPNENAFGHYGAGGSCVVADPDHGFGFAYVTNKMSSLLIDDPRPLRLLAALYSAL